MRSKDRKTLYIIFSALIISVLTLTTAYAALSTILKVEGNAVVSSASWYIAFENIRIKTGSVGANKKPVITRPDTIEFDVTLNKPGDYFEFTVDIVNKGTIDAMIESITKTELDSKQKRYLSYEITYSDGNKIGTKQLLKSNKQKNIKVNVTYNKDISLSDIPTSTEQVKLSFTANYYQSDDSSVIGPEGAGNEIPKLVRMTKGNISNPQVGDMFCIKDECFHVFKSDKNTITGLAQYNLYVGGWFDNINDDLNIKYWTPYGNEATGIQNSKMIAWDNINTKWYGTTVFSSKSQKGVNYSDYKGSIVEKYVLNYKNIIESYGVTLNEIRIINISELFKLGCIKLDEETGDCQNTPPWVYSTSYWCMDATSSTHIWRIATNSDFRSVTYETATRGVRPVVTINETYFK